GLAGALAGHLTRGCMSGTGNFKGYGTYIGADGFIRVLGAVLCLVVGVSVAGPFGIAVGIAGLLAVPVALRVQKPELEEGPEAALSEVGSALILLLVASLCAFAIMNIGPVLVKLLADDSQSAAAGRFVNGVVIARIPLFLFQAVQASLLPKLASLAGAGRHDDFRAGLKRLLAVVVAIGLVATITAWAIGHEVVGLLFGAGFELSRTDLAYLAAASAAYMLALALAQALIALSAYARVVIGWASGIVVFTIVTATQSGLLTRVERGFLAGATASAAVMGLLLATRMAKGIVASADTLADAAFDVPIEP
ncbi:MAG: lipid II flippase MurJ, partial [Acidimicrobiia bacterium]